MIEAALPRRAHFKAWIAACLTTALLGQACTEREQPAPAASERPAKRLASPETPAPPHVPEIDAAPRTGPIALDGKLDEADWQRAQPTGPFVNTMQGTPGSFQVEARILYDAEALYVAFEVEDDYLKSQFGQHDDHLWEQDTVEIMIDPDGDQKNYFEIQVAPTGVVFETAYESWRTPRPFGHVEWDSKVEAGVMVRGQVNDAEADEGYTVEMRIPVTALQTSQAKTRPPAASEHYRVNLFVMDALPRGQRAVGWSAPLVGDFHKLDRFGIVHFLP